MFRPVAFNQTSLVTDGLIFNLDASDRTSYPQTGVTWYDLSGNGYNGTLINGTSYSPANGGTMVFDGIDDYIDCGNNPALNPTTQLTLMCWVNKTTTNNFHHFISKFPTVNRSFTIGSLVGSGNLFFQRSTDGGDQGISGAFNINVSTGRWFFVAASYNATTSTLLMCINNQIQQSSLSGNIFVSTSNVNIGRRSGTGQYYPGRIANALMYSRALTSNELIQNFEATRNKFGI